MISTVVLPVAGLGTRFLPATKAVPKELLPVVDKPLVQYAVEEAWRAGIRHVVLVSSPVKQALERHLQPADPALEAELEAKGKQALLAALRSAAPQGLKLSVVYQDQPLGLGHAVFCAREVLAATPEGEEQTFAVMLPDDFIDAPGQGCLADMVALHRET
ncbi:MAG: sugar phosphate nucleotidyltransferase, partial [Perlucidibaca sp.]